MERRHGEFMVSILGIENGVPQGNFLDLYKWEKHVFNGWGDLILQMDQMLYQGRLMIDYPPTEQVMQESSSYPKGKYSFYIRVMYTEFSSWQGQVLGSNLPKTTFRSVLDLLHKVNAGIEKKAKHKPVYLKEGNL